MHKSHSNTLNNSVSNVWGLFKINGFRVRALGEGKEITKTNPVGAGAHIPLMRHLTVPVHKELTGLLLQPVHHHILDVYVQMNMQKCFNRTTVIDRQTQCLPIQRIRHTWQKHFTVYFIYQYRRTEPKWDLWFHSIFPKYCYFSFKFW
jgi:hypothetical protein